MVYRKGTSAFILNDKKEFILVLGNTKHTYWKIPAGGIERNETDIEALHREVKEELGIEINILEKSKYIEKFDWSEKVRQKKLKTKGYYFEGQERSVFITKIKKNQTFKLQEEEISDYKWVNKDNYKKYISLNHQLEFMEKVINEFLEYF
ncbi:MAG: NUDIX hydrolase [Candidatus ainarchaeum sp.]|nr:NUDIX hydrolase [Candidatus ainarchaeum sp.]MDD3976291.1 NUDIX hydrolase [Candidatus ainarchaeum sp.]